MTRQSPYHETSVLLERPSMSFDPDTPMLDVQVTRLTEPNYRTVDGLCAARREAQDQGLDIAVVLLPMEVSRPLYKDVQAYGAYTTPVSRGFVISGIEVQVTPNIERPLCVLDNGFTLLEWKQLRSEHELRSDLARAGRDLDIALRLQESTSHKLKVASVDLYRAKHSWWGRALRFLRVWR
jgi:hypothetical protein